ncbi:MAG: 2-hydroxymuconate tautomerase [Actinomycetota bacterium]|nr:2-hydroxymuconate tautomerase [Actinomycetota bacterium]
MPLVHIDMLEGRSPEKVADMITTVSEAIATSLETNIGSVRIVVNEMQPHQYGVGGKPWPVVAEERSKAREAGQ